MAITTMMRTTIVIYIYTQNRYSQTDWDCVSTHMMEIIIWMGIDNRAHLDMVLVSFTQRLIDRETLECCCTCCSYPFHCTLTFFWLQTTIKIARRASWEWYNSHLAQTPIFDRPLQLQFALSNSYENFRASTFIQPTNRKKIAYLTLVQGLSGDAGEWTRRSQVQLMQLRSEGIFYRDMSWSAVKPTGFFGLPWFWIYI